MDNLLDKFVKCIDNKSISKTAKQIGISQPALSIALQNLEKEFGAKLFFRSKQGIIPTKVGILVYKEAKKTLTQFNNIKLRVNELNKQTDRTLSIGMIDNFGLEFLKNIWKRVNLKIPNLKLSIDINNSETLIRSVLNQEIDFGIITFQLTKNIPGELIQKYLITEDLILVCSKELQGHFRNLSDISKFDFYSYNERSTTNKLIKNFFQINKIKVKYSLFSTNPNFTVELLKLGKGIAFLPRNFVDEEINRGILIQILPATILERKLGLIYHRDVYMDTRQKQILNIIQDNK